MLWDNTPGARRRKNWQPQAHAECYGLRRGYTWLATNTPQYFNDWLPDASQAMLFSRHQADQIASSLNKARPPMMPPVEVVKLE